MSLSIKLFLLAPIVSAILLIALFIAIIYNILTKKSIKDYFYIKHSLSIGYTLIGLLIIFITVSIGLVFEDISTEIVLKDIAPNKSFDLEIESKVNSIIVYTKNNTDDNPNLETLLTYHISQDRTPISNSNIELMWDNNIAMIKIYGEVETLYLNIWIDNKTNNFKYELNPIKNIGNADNIPYYLCFL